MTMQEFQDAGEPYRKDLDIDGTAGDAQDRKHPYTTDRRFPDTCIVCGLSDVARVHDPT